MPSVTGNRKPVKRYLKRGGQARAKLDADIAFEERTLATQARVWESSEMARHEKCPRLKRFYDVQMTGVYDTLTADAMHRTYMGNVGGEVMMAQVLTLENDLLINFWAATPGVDKHRRLLIEADGEGRTTGVWLEVGDTVAPHRDGKYAKAAEKIMAMRAYEREHGIQRTEGGTR